MKKQIKEWRLAKAEGGRVKFIVNENGGRITYIDDDVSKANAALLAAAPTLLAAAKAALGLAWEVGCESEDGVLTLLPDSRGDLYRQLSAAIAAAEGEAK